MYCVEMVFQSSRQCSHLFLVIGLIFCAIYLYSLICYQRTLLLSPQIIPKTCETCFMSISSKFRHITPENLSPSSFMNHYIPLHKILLNLVLISEGTLHISEQIAFFEVVRNEFKEKISHSNVTSFFKVEIRDFYFETSLSSQYQSINKSVIMLDLSDSRVFHPIQEILTEIQNSFECTECIVENIAFYVPDLNNSESAFVLRQNSTESSSLSLSSTLTLFPFHHQSEPLYPPSSTSTSPPLILSPPSSLPTRLTLISLPPDTFLPSTHSSSSANTNPPPSSYLSLSKSTPLYSLSALLSRDLLLPPIFPLPSQHPSALDLPSTFLLSPIEEWSLALLLPSLSQTSLSFSLLGRKLVATQSWTAGTGIGMGGGGGLGAGLWAEIEDWVGPLIGETRSRDTNSQLTKEKEKGKDSYLFLDRPLSLPYLTGRLVLSLLQRHLELIQRTETLLTSLSALREKEGGTEGECGLLNRSHISSELSDLLESTLNIHRAVYSLLTRPTSSSLLSSSLERLRIEEDMPQFDLFPSSLPPSLEQHLAVLAPFWIPLLVPLFKGWREAFSVPLNSKNIS